ncbi:MAG: non-canonical purine NTP pyrophosphatase [Mollicutes bacterium PWAP]|nr:non-canonical purine NTP pyrophosphatase [Mollicutes bacterium PWAP]
MKILLASTNEEKIKEYKNLFKDTNIQIVLLKDLGYESLDAPEDHETFEENALQKANFYFKKFNIPILSDDSGIVVPILGSFPGVKSKRWMIKSSYLEKTKELIKLSKKSNPHSYYVCSLAFVNKNIKKTFTGTVHGKLSVSKNTNGFAFDNFFIENKTNSFFSDISTSKKNLISHRSKATKKMISYFESKKIK